jgi:hypothetical protein
MPFTNDAILRVVRTAKRRLITVLFIVPALIS